MGPPPKKKEKEKRLYRRGSIHRPAAHESIALTTGLLRLAVATVKRGFDKAKLPEKGSVWESGSVGHISFSVIALIIGKEAWVGRHAKTFPVSV